MFQRATRQQTKLKMAITGPSGSGKTWTSLTLATAIAAGKPIALVDAERGKSSMYAENFAFDICPLGKDPSDDEPYHPQRYIDAIHGAVSVGYGVLVIDSLSHAWFAKGGVLEQVEKISKRLCNGNTFSAWGKGGNDLQNGLMDTILQAPIHIICTMRSKQAYVQEQQGDKGKTVVRKVGMETVQRDSTDYEFDVVGDMDDQNSMIIRKTRIPHLAGKLINKPDAKFGESIARWLAGAATTQSAPATPPARQTQPQTSQVVDEHAERVKALLAESKAGEQPLMNESELRTFMGTLGAKTTRDVTPAMADKWEVMLAKLRDERDAKLPPVEAEDTPFAPASHPMPDEAYEEEEALNF